MKNSNIVHLQDYTKSQDYSLCKQTVPTMSHHEIKRRHICEKCLNSYYKQFETKSD